MKIKTVCRGLDNRCEFDQDVNQALEEGWQLVKRDVLNGGPLTDTRYQNRMLYAELVLPDPPAEPAEPDLFACAEAIRQACARVTSCKDCPLHDFCENTAPHEWGYAAND